MPSSWLPRTYTASLASGLFICSCLVSRVFITRANREVNCVLHFFLKIYLPLFYKHWYFACLYACEFDRSPGSGVTGSCELPCEYWILNPGPPEVQPVLLPAELSLWPMYCILSHPILHFLSMS